MAGESYNLIRGRQVVVPLANQSGAQRAEGDVVVGAVGNDDSFTTTVAAGDIAVIGVVVETIAAAATGRVCTGGYVPTLKVDAATARGDPLKTSTTVGLATPAVPGDEGIFAVARSATVGAGTVSALLLGPAAATAIISKTSFGFMQSFVAASQAAVALAVLGQPNSFTRVLSYAGSVLAISVDANEARSAGTLTVDATVNGAVTGLQAVLNAGDPQYAYAVQAKDTDVFAGGDRLGVKITTDGAWAPTTAEIVVTVIIEM